MTTFELLSVSEIMRDYIPHSNTGSVSWEEKLEEYKNGNHPFNWDAVLTLLEQLKRDGGFREPLRLETQEYREQWQPGAFNEETLRVLDGNHRVIAASLVGFDVVLEVAFEYLGKSDDVAEDDFVRAPSLVTKITYPDEKLPDKNELILARAISCEVSESIWMSTGVSICLFGETHILWDGSPNRPPSSYTPQECASISKYFADFLQAEDIDYMSITTYEFVPDPWDDEEIDNG